MSPCFLFFDECVLLYLNFSCFACLGPVLHYLWSKLVIIAWHLCFFGASLPFMILSSKSWYRTYFPIEILICVALYYYTLLYLNIVFATVLEYHTSWEKSYHTQLISFRWGSQLSCLLLGTQRGRTLFLLGEMNRSSDLWWICCLGGGSYYSLSCIFTNPW